MKNPCGLCTQRSRKSNELLWFMGRDLKHPAAALPVPPLAPSLIHTPYRLRLAGLRLVVHLLILVGCDTERRGQLRALSCARDVDAATDHVDARPVELRRVVKR